MAVVGKDGIRRLLAAVAACSGSRGPELDRRLAHDEQLLRVNRVFQRAHGADEIGHGAVKRVARAVAHAEYALGRRRGEQ